MYLKWASKVWLSIQISYFPEKNCFRMRGSFGVGWWVPQSLSPCSFQMSVLAVAVAYCCWSLVSAVVVNLCCWLLMLAVVLTANVGC